MKILIVEDQEITKSIFRDTLSSHFELQFAGRGEEVKQALYSGTIDLIILDINLPEDDGFEICAALKAESGFENIPIIFVSGETNISRKAIAFELGAEDYLTKPFDPEELLIRVRAKLRQRQASKTHLVHFGKLCLDQKTFLTMLDGKEVNLTPKQFQVVLYLISNRSRIITRDQLIHHVWGSQSDITDRCVDTMISRIKKKLGHSNFPVTAIPGVGYRLLPEENE